jgi:hypothetical protein
MDQRHQVVNRQAHAQHVVADHGGQHAAPVGAVDQHDGRAAAPHPPQPGVVAHGRRHQQAFDTLGLHAVQGGLGGAFAARRVGQQGEVALGVQRVEDLAAGIREISAQAKAGTQIFIATLDRAVPFDIFSFYRGMRTYVGIDTLALDCVASCDLVDILRGGMEAGSLRPFAVNASCVSALPDALAAFRRVLCGADERIDKLGAAVMPMAQADFETLLDDETAAAARLVKSAGIRVG